MKKKTVLIPLFEYDKDEGDLYRLSAMVRDGWDIVNIDTKDQGEEEEMILFTLEKYFNQ